MNNFFFNVWIEQVTSLENHEKTKSANYKNREDFYARDIKKYFNKILQYIYLFTNLEKEIPF